MKLLKKLLKIMACLMAVLIFLMIVTFGVLSVAEYKPAESENVQIETAATAESHFTVGDKLKIMSWNIGYGCLGDNADFFMDGGKSVKTADGVRLDYNMTGIVNTIEDLDPDVAFIQEVDLNSHRSEHYDETAEMRKSFVTGSSAFAYNYNVLFVPYPIPPIGHVEAGIMTLVDDDMTSAERIQLPVPFSWPVRLANLKRCLLVSRVPVEGTNKELVLVNLHLEAYDDGSGKKAQTAILKRILEDEMKKGNYVIAGGDFNQTFSNIDTSMYPVYDGNWEAGIMDAGEFENNFNIIMDNRIPSCRSLDKPYAGADLSKFQYYVIDGFIVSKNLEIESYEVLDKEFKYSDHNPLMVTVKIAE